MLLKRVSPSFPPHLQRLIPQLESAGIRTTENIIFTPLPTLLSALPPNALVEEYDLSELVERCLRLTAPRSRTGAEAVEETGQRGLRVTRMSNGRDMPLFGTAGLDGLMGDQGSAVTVEICGPQRVGKSLLALHAVLRHLTYHPSARCRWMDTDGSFSAARAKSILELWDCENTPQVLDRIKLSPCYDIDRDLWTAIEEIKSEDTQGDGTGRTSIVVIDSLTPLLKDRLMGSGAQGHAALAAVMEELGELAHEHGVTVLVTNATSSSRPSNLASVFSGTDIKPALGVGMTYLADVTLLVQSTGKLFGEIDEGERDRAWNKPGLRGVVEVVKSRVAPSGRWAVFETDGKSLQDVVPAATDDERTIRMSAGQTVGEQRPIFGPLKDTVIP